MYNVTMSKVKGGDAIRSNTVRGICLNQPIIGESFTMTSDSLDFTGGVRLITTSTVKSVVKQADSIIFETLNSTYRLIFE